MEMYTVAITVWHLPSFADEQASARACFKPIIVPIIRSTNQSVRPSNSFAPVSTNLSLIIEDVAILPTMEHGMRDEVY